jgi:autotransporter-associated beta strand protein
MKTLILTAIRCSLMFLVPTVMYAISTQWDLDPISGDWNTAANWTPMGVPNEPADTATFGLSHNTDVSISADTEVNGITFTAAATNPYTITASPGLKLTISGVGIVNNSGIAQNFATAIDAFGNSGTIVFSKSATAGTNVAYLNNGSFGFGGNGQMIFKNNSTAGSANIRNERFGSTAFFNRSTAGSANIVNDDGSTAFFNRSTAGSAFIDTSASSSSISFFDNSTAGTAFIFVNDVSFLTFSGRSSAGNALIGAVGATTFQGQVSFYDSSTAGNATMRGAGAFYFYGSSRGGTAQIELFQSFILPFTVGFLDISDHNAPGVTIGSIEGDGNVFLGSNNLTVGSNNLSTTFSGVIQDGGPFGGGGTGGSLTKIGTGTLDLTANNTYTGNTNVNRGVLQVDGSITGNTFVNHRGTLAGTGIINGNVMNNDFGTVRPGGAIGAPGMLTIVHNYTQAQYATLMIQIAGTNTGDFSLLNVLGNANLNGFLDPVLLNGFVPTIGDSFVFLKYASLTGGGFQILDPVFNNGTEQWSVAYLRNRAILTVEQHAPGVPDQGSTFLLLTLGLLGLVTFRWQLLRGQP